MEKLLQILKVLEMPFKILVFILIASGVLFFLPSSVRDYLLMTEFYNTIGPFLGPVFIISFLYVLFTLLCKLIVFISRKNEENRSNKTIMELVNNLSHKEIVVIREFLFQESDVITALMEDEGGSSLLAKGIVRNVQNITAVYVFGTPVKIQINSRVKGFLTKEALGLKENPNGTDLKKYRLERPAFVSTIDGLQNLQNRVMKPF